MKAFYKISKKQNERKLKLRIFCVFLVILSIIQPISLLSKNASALNKASAFTTRESVLSKYYFYSIESCLTGLGLDFKKSKENQSGSPYLYSINQLTNYEWFPEGMGDGISTNVNTIPVSFLEKTIGEEGGKGIRDAKIYCDEYKGSNRLLKEAFSFWGLSADDILKNLICSSDGANSGLFEKPVEDKSINCSESTATGSGTNSFVLNYAGDAWDDIDSGLTATQLFKNFIVNRIYQGDDSSLSSASPTFSQEEAYWFNQQIVLNFCGGGEKSETQPSDTSNVASVKWWYEDSKTMKDIWINKSDSKWWNNSNGKEEEIPLWEDPSKADGYFGYTKPESGKPQWTTCSQSIATMTNSADAYKNSHVPDESDPTYDDITNSPITDSPTADNPTCGSTVTGIGWIVCPIINSLIALNDGAWQIVQGLLVVNPLNQTGSNNYIYQAWGIIRNIANIAFVIIFLIVIFSQITGFGIQNYGIKKLLPKIIVGAILVNLSFLIMQISVDLSNIVGKSLYGLVLGVTPDIPTNLGWSYVLNLITGGLGTGLAIGGLALVSGSATAFYLLLPGLAIAALTLLAAVFTLMFRQAAIPILVILAPLAFVAYLLPNTESWFKKWKKILIDALLLYPLAALIFSGARFAAVILIGNNTDWFRSMMGMIVLALPLGALPFLASKGGALTDAAFKGMKNVFGKLKNPINDFAKPRADLAKSRYLSEDGRTRFGRSAVGGFARRTAQRNAMRTRELKLRTDTANKNFDTRFENSARGMEARDNANLADVVSNETKNNSNIRFQNSAIGGGAILQEKITGSRLKTAQAHNDIVFQSSADGTNAIMDERTADTQLKAAQAMNARLVSEATTGTAEGIDSLVRNGFDRANATRISTNLQYAQRRVDVENAATNSANNLYKQEFNDAIVSDPSLAQELGGIDSYGAARATAIATSQIAKARAENVANAATLFTSQKYDLKQLLAATQGTLIDGSVATIEQKQAAMQKLIQSGDADMQKNIINHVAGLSGADPDRVVLQQALKDLEVSNSKRSKGVSGKMLGLLDTGTLTTDYDTMELTWMKSEKPSPTEWITLDAGEAKDMSRLSTTGTFSPDEATRLHSSLLRAFEDEKILNQLKPEQTKEMLTIFDQMRLRVPGLKNINPNLRKIL